MITCTLRGQQGNQMFIAATVIAHALKMKTSYGFPERSGKRNQFPFMFPELGLVDHSRIEFDYYHRESQFGIYSSIPNRKSLVLQGYFQSELYFKDYRQQIIESFNIPKYETKQDTISLHIRRGDSLNHQLKLPQPTDRYLDEAISLFDGYKILVFSDDIEWCKNKFKEKRFEFYQGDNSKVTMGQMASCSHNIIVNSTFSWWGAWLGNQQGRKVICPHVDSWFGESYKDKLSAQDIPCVNWTQISY